EGDDSDLRQRPLLSKTGNLSGHIQLQFLNNFLHPCEVEIFAKVEVAALRPTKRNLCRFHALHTIVGNSWPPIGGTALQRRNTPMLRRPPRLESPDAGIRRKAGRTGALRDDDGRAARTPRSNDGCNYRRDGV